VTAEGPEGEPGVNSPARPGAPGGAVPIVTGAVSTAAIALIGVGVVLGAAVVLLALRAARLSRQVSLAEDRLRRLEEQRSTERREGARLEAALRATGVGVLVTDPTGRVIFANPAALPYLSGQPGQAIVASGMAEAVADALRRGKAQTRELELYTPRRRVVRLEAVPLEGEEGGHLHLGAVAYVADVTEERRVEAMRRDFVAAVGHELKTPLGAMALLAETLAGHAGDPAVAGQLAERLRAEADRLARLVDDMLDLANAEEFVPAADPVPVAALMGEVAAAAQEEANRRSVALIVEEVPPGTVVPGDQRHLRAMLANLVDNAIKYSDPQPGRPPPRVWLRARPEQDWVVLEVEDEGIGIPEGHHDRIFERFYRVDRARSRATGGTGLGLSIVRHVALNHGGDVGVESRLGEGSRFRVRLPRGREP
jgi:signal transduction histidine kinase